MNKILGQLFFMILRLLDFTYRYRYSNEHLRDQALKESGYIYALWHQNIIACLLAQKLERHIMVVSPSNDGEFVAIACEKLGHQTARGSSSREGKKALLNMIKNIRTGTPGAVSVDGPKGPPHKVKRGIVEIAKVCNVAILPYATYPERFWSLKKSWDQFRVPKPFSRIIIRYGKPIAIPKNLELNNFDEFCQKIEGELIKAQLEAREILLDSQQLAQCKKFQGDLKRRHNLKICGS